MEEIKEARKIIKNYYTTEEALLMMSNMMKELDKMQEKLREIYGKLEDRNRKIYFDKKYFGLTNAQIELKYGIGKRQIQKICKKIDKSSPLVRF